MPISKHRKCHSDICYRDKTLITRYQASREPHDATSGQLLIVDLQRGKICWRFGSRTLNRYRSLISVRLVSVWEVNFVVFNSMLKYVINRLMHAFFHIRIVIIPRPISTLVLKPFGRYRSLRMITVLIWKRACNHLLIITYLEVITSILPTRKHRKYHSDICHRGKTLITRYQASREPNDVTSA